MSEKVLISVFAKMRRKFLRMAMHILPDEDDAADALQDAFCRLWPRRDNINTNAEAEALTATTLRNICIDNVRKRKVETVPLNDEHDRIDDESHVADREEKFKRVKDIIDRELTQQQKEVLELKEFQGFGVEKIAEKLKIGEAAVRMNLSRARKKIRECYRKEVHNE